MLIIVRNYKQEVSKQKDLRRFFTWPAFLFNLNGFQLGDYQLASSQLFLSEFISNLEPGEPKFGYVISWAPKCYIWGQPLFLQQFCTVVFSLLSQHLFLFLCRFCCLVECLCLGFYFIKRFPNHISISSSHPGSVVDHRNLGRKRPSGLPFSRLGWAVALEHVPFLLVFATFSNLESDARVSWTCILLLVSVGVQQDNTKQRFSWWDSPR